jgi:hypothetical protein
MEPLSFLTPHDKMHDKWFTGNESVKELFISMNCIMVGYLAMQILTFELFVSRNAF